MTAVAPAKPTKTAKTAPTQTVSSPEEAAALGSILSVWAHPDDEAYLAASLMTLSVQGGSHVACVTATKGEHGTPDPDRCPPAVMAEIRTAEMAASLSALDVTDHEWLGYEDGTLDRVPTEVGIELMSRRIEQMRPATIVTFGPDGMTGHPDHLAVFEWTTRAWERLGRPGRLLYATKTPQYLAEHQDLHELLPVFGEGFPHPTPLDRVAVNVEPDAATLARKVAALEAHQSQSAFLIETFGPDRYRDWVRAEFFLAA